MKSDSKTGVLLRIAAKYLGMTVDELLKTVGPHAWDTWVGPCDDWRLYVPDEIAEKWDDLPLDARLVAYWLAEQIVARENVED